MRFTESFRALSTAQKPPRGVSFVTRFVVRPIGRVCAALAHSWGLTPNTVTVVSGAVTLAGIAVLALLAPSTRTGVASAALLLFGFGLDSADGQVARLAGSSSLTGEWLDHVLDAAKMVLIHSAVLVSWYRFTELDRTWLLVPLAYQFIAVVTFSALTLVAVLKRTSPPFQPTVLPPSRLRATLLLPVDYGVLCLSFLAWGFVSVYAVLYATLMVLNAVILVALLVRWYQSLREVDATRSG